ncbi:hypothetical protein M885DRAFT_521507 [Pelagophyceae sp. CCMP2097]|nr:hypothetical protein M885DRAFT_521507 [Pelagophyceae sp. CCMP2097]
MGVCRAAALAACVLGLTASSIPRVLVTSHARPLEELPLPLAANVRLWAGLNPGFALAYFDDDAQRAYMAANCTAPRCAEAYGALGSGAAKADLFRVAFLYHTGGWWFDADLRPGAIETHCDVGAAGGAKLFLVREPKRGHVRFMLVGGVGHPLLLANLRRQISNILKSKALPPGKQPGALHVTGPFTLGRTLCSPFAFVAPADLAAGVPDAEIVAAAEVLRASCTNDIFDGRGKAERPAPQANWAETYAGGTALAFRFDGCSGHWHRPGAPRMNYQKVLSAMNVSHHLKIPAR